MFQSTELYRGVGSHDIAACVQLYAWEITAMESIEEYGENRQKSHRHVSSNKYPVYFQYKNKKVIKSDKVLKTKYPTIDSG